MEVRVDRWAETRPKAGGAFWPFPVDPADEEEEEAEFDLFRRVPPSAVEAERRSRGWGTGSGFWFFPLHWQKEKQNTQNAWNFQQANPTPTKRRRTTASTTPMIKYLLLKNCAMLKGLG